MPARPTAMRMELTGWGLGADKAVGVRFAEGDAAAVGAPADKKWISAGPAVWGRGAAENNTYRVLPARWRRARSPSPRSSPVRRRSARSVPGTVTTRSLRAARTAARDKAPRELRTAGLGQFMVLGIKETLTVDLWVDDEGRAERRPPGADLLDGDGVPYSSGEAKDRWSLPCSRERARWPKDPLKLRTTRAGDCGSCSWSGSVVVRDSSGRATPRAPAPGRFVFPSPF